MFWLQQNLGSHYPEIPSPNLLRESVQNPEKLGLARAASFASLAISERQMVEKSAGGMLPASSTAFAARQNIISHEDSVLSWPPLNRPMENAPVSPQNRNTQLECKENVQNALKNLKVINQTESTPRPPLNHTSLSVERDGEMGQKKTNAPNQINKARDLKVISMIQKLLHSKHAYSQGRSRGNSFDLSK